MKKKYCICIDEGYMMMLEELTDNIMPYTKLSKSSAIEFCIRITYELNQKGARKLCKEKELTKQLTKGILRTQQTKLKS